MLYNETHTDRAFETGWFFWCSSFGLFNLLPVRQLDGGRALFFLLCKHVNETTANRVVTITSLACLFLAAAGAALLCLRQGFSLSLVVVVAYLAAGC